MLAATLVSLPAAARRRSAQIRIKVSGSSDEAKSLHRALRAKRGALLACRRRAPPAIKARFIGLGFQAHGKRLVPKLLKTNLDRKIARCVLRRLMSLNIAGQQGFTVVRIIFAAAARGPVHGNVRTKVFHYPDCKRYRCKRCTKRFGDALGAVGAGYIPHRRCTPANAVVPPLPRPKRMTLTDPGGRARCKNNKDCAFLPSGPCNCPPCRYQWRATAHKDLVRRIQSRYNAMGACGRGRCPTCKAPGGYLGSRAVCRRGICVVRP